MGVWSVKAGLSAFQIIAVGGYDRSASSSVSFIVMKRASNLPSLGLRLDLILSHSEEDGEKTKSSFLVLKRRLQALSP
jgi:hypothetical protein